MTFLYAALVVGTVAVEAQVARRIGTIENVQDPEDLVALPGARWVIASGRRVEGKAGQIYLIDRKTGRSEVAFPVNGAAATNGAVGAGCGAPPDPRWFEAHGLGLVSGPDGRSRLYVVDHASKDGGREAIEVFDIDVSAGNPSLALRTCVSTPAHAWFNDVGALPEGGFAATNFMDPGDKDTNQKLKRGEATGNVIEWHAGTGFRIVPNSAMSSTASSLESLIRSTDWHHRRN